MRGPKRAALVVHGGSATLRLSGAGTFGIGGNFLHAALASAPSTRLTGVFVRATSRVRQRTVSRSGTPIAVRSATATAEATEDAAAPCVVMFVPAARRRPAHWAVCRNASIAAGELDGAAGSSGSGFDGQPVLLPVDCVYYAAVTSVDEQQLARQLRDNGGVLFPPKSLEWLPFPGVGKAPPPAFTPLLIPTVRRARASGPSEAHSLLDAMMADFVDGTLGVGAFESGIEALTGGMDDDVFFSLGGVQGETISRMPENSVSTQNVPGRRRGSGSGVASRETLARELASAGVQPASYRALIDSIVDPGVRKQQQQQHLEAGTATSPLPAEVAAAAASDGAANAEELTLDPINLVLRVQRLRGAIVKIQRRRDERSRAKILSPILAANDFADPLYATATADALLGAELASAAAAVDALERRLELRARSIKVNSALAQRLATMERHVKRIDARDSSIGVALRPLLDRIAATRATHAEGRALAALSAPAALTNARAQRERLAASEHTAATRVAASRRVAAVDALQRKKAEEERLRQSSNSVLVATRALELIGIRGAAAQHALRNPESIEHLFREAEAKIARDERRSKAVQRDAATESACAAARGASAFADQHVGDAVSEVEATAALVAAAAAVPGETSAQRQLQRAQETAATALDAMAAFASGEDGGKLATEAAGVERGWVHTGEWPTLEEGRIVDVQLGEPSVSIATNFRMLLIQVSDQFCILLFLLHHNFSCLRGTTSH